LCSSQLLEANLGGLLSEASPADHEFVLSDEALRGSANTAAASVFAVLSGVRFKLVGHFSSSGVFLDWVYLIIISSNSFIGTPFFNC